MQFAAALRCKVSVLPKRAKCPQTEADAKIAGKPVYRQTDVTQREGEAPKVCLEFGQPRSTSHVYCRDWTGPQCRTGKGDSSNRYGDSCDMCWASVDGEPLLYTRYEMYEGDIVSTVCESCTKAAFKALRVSQRRLTNGTL